MLTYITKRLLLAIPTLIGISIVTFVLIQMAPGDPAELQTQGIMDPEMSNQAYEQLRQYYGLDKPLHVQYGNWMKRAVTLDFGDSWSTDSRPVIEKIGERLWPTMSVALLSIFISLLFSIPLGLYQAVRQDSLFDTASSTFLYMIWSIPSYVIAIPLILYIGVKWDLLPFQGMRSDNYQELGSLGKMWDLVQHYFLITFCTTAGTWAYYSRFIRQTMLEVIRMDYIRTARAKGQTERVILWKHAFRNTMIPVLTLLGQILPALVGGSVILEMIFNWPGLGQLYFQSMLARDTPTIMAMTMISAVLVLAGILLADISYAWADPRVRYD